MPKTKLKPSAKKTGQVNLRFTPPEMRAFNAGAKRLNLTPTQLFRASVMVFFRVNGDYETARLLELDLPKRVCDFIMEVTEKLQPGG